MISENRTSQRAADFVAVVRLLLVLHAQHGGVVEWTQLQALHGRGGDRIAREVIVRFTREPVAAGLGHRADDAAERAAVFRRNAAGLHLDFLQIFEHGVLPRTAIRQAVGVHAVDREGVLGAARAVDLKPAFDVALIDAG